MRKPEIDIRSPNDIQIDEAKKLLIREISNFRKGTLALVTELDGRPRKMMTLGKTPDLLTALTFTLCKLALLNNLDLKDLQDVTALTYNKLKEIK